AFVLEGEGAIATARKTIGATNPADAEPGSLRGRFALAMPNNLAHGSDSPESAAREIPLWFPDGLVLPSTAARLRAPDPRQLDAGDRRVHRAARTRGMAADTDR